MFQYEIKQLRAHLGRLDEEACENLTEELKQRKRTQNDYDEELDKAIALSKIEYEVKVTAVANNISDVSPKITHGIFSEKLCNSVTSS